MAHIESYTNISLGTGFDQWSKSDVSTTLNQFGHEVGSLSHFVLSPYKKSDFDEGYFFELSEKIGKRIFD